ncbi:hypothetical protein H6G54_28860 [Anabaena cylindrica FACHB-243]|uniref:Uncharacterized protein n=1 Tax=Anabaena cylindrica (strain ATCC 27899 / PCC 7122) TaxID=272123 RepID=K9ZPL8_ANACC|nr:MULTISPECIES: hypothetical protein [Anabaena]AFZ61141.1 hypothetical protein Anacy_5848 [Anabaena cylindrica PCC 7122]MBD2421617.1 hypothetical protein [Anabaena cylindrica FACHB-243]MBY5280484.1 hypothetical protein [Anabaena sp. CCAP 1446/1C]MBY5308215.1 hypothetical protein [Anabaena sp. CCAP 1446/1C]MCM2405482.1 hypothetical protein [Anabaena sp. CCAP 1446/1C]
MTLEFKHFDTRLKQWIHTDGNAKNADSILTEKLDNTLLEFFLPERDFSFGQMDEHCTAEDLKNHPNGDVLLFSSKTRLLYGSPECLEVIEKLCPDRKDRGAYGSIFLGSCKNAIHEKLNILVVDDATGENGGFLKNEDAWKLVGDCYGQISTELYNKLTNKNELKDKNFCVIQHRFGWRENDGEDTKYRFGKGTLRPQRIEELSWRKDSPKIDLIIPISSFKGTDKDNPSTPIKPQIKPGLYNQTIWLGEKSQSQKGKTAISQLLASFPQGIKDFAEELEKQAQELAEIQKDPRKVAQLYCEKYEKRKAFIGQQKPEQLENETPDKPVELYNDNPNLDDLQEDSESEQDDLLMYKIIKADLLGHNQLLETEKVKQELTRFVQNEWRDIALGRVLTFDREMIIPSKELKNGEICVPWMIEGEKILNFRSPFLNANGLCVSINKHIEDYLGPDGNPLAGIIIVNDEDHKRIQARIEALKAQGIETEELDPIETESERQGRDFDGDCIGVELASKYPNFTAEAEYRNLPENAYAPTVKLKKQSFYREDGTQPEFEEIAIHMSDGISVGIINNHVTALEALESEIETLITYGNSQQQTEYLDQVGSHYKKLVNLENNQNHPQAIREEYREQMQEFLKLASVQDRNSQVIEQAMAINRNMYRQMIEAACFQNQIAVDLFKSAKKPDMEVIAENKRYLYRDVNYIKDKKSSSAYLKEGINTTGYSPVELLINQVNKYFEASHLESRPIIQFQDLFKGVEFTPQQKFQAILTKQEFDDKFNVATRLNKRRETEQGPYAVVKTSNGTEITITNLTRYEHPGIWKGSTLNIRLEEIPEKYRSLQRPHTLLAIAQIDGETENGEPKYSKLGTVSQQSVIDYKLKPGMITQGATLVELKPELRESQIKLLFQEAYAVAENFYNLIPEDQKLAVAAATWNISASRQDELEQGDNSSFNSRKKVSNFVFATFGKEIVSQLDELQFLQLKVLGIGKEGDNFVGREWNPQEKYSIEIQACRYPPGHERHNSRLVFVKDNDEEYKEFAVLEQRTGQLAIGTQAQAYIKSGETYTATATINLPSQPPINITIREISKFSHAGKTFNNEQVTLTIGNVAVPVDTAKIKLDGQTLGELDTDSIQELRKINYLANGNPLQLKLKSIGDSQHEGGFIIAESPHGNLLKINKINVYDFKGQVFTGEEYKSVSLEVPTSKNRDAVFLNGELLGVLHYKKDKEALQNLGVLKHGQQSSVNCTLQSNFSHTFINIEPNTVQYPQTWTKEAQAFQDNSQLNTVTKQEVMVEKSWLLLEKIKERPTILFTSQEDKVLGLIGIAVDNHKTELVQNWFKSKNIEFNVLPPQDLPLETKKGLSVIYLVSSTIPSDDFDALKAKFGEPLSADGKNSAYNQYLNSLPNRPHIIGERLDKVQELATTTIPVIVTPNLSNNNPPQQTIVVPENLQTISAVTQVLPANSTIVSKPEEKDVVISGKPVQMVFPLKMHGEPNALPVSTTIDAMRGYGRCHTTRTYEPYKAYGFKEGDIAIASGSARSAIAESGRSAIAVSSSQQVAFRVGKQYRITPEMIADAAYQQQWGAMEKHSSRELTTFKDKPEVWGLNMEPLGDYVNGKIVPFPSPNLEKSLITPAIPPPLSTAIPLASIITSPVNIGSRSSDPLGAAMTNPTVKAKELGKIQGEYPVSFRDNAAVPAGKYGPETYAQDKPAGVPFVSAEQAYQHYKTTVPLGEPRIQLMAEIIQAKLEQHPKLFAAITQRGGVEWLENCTHYVTSARDNYWEGKGKESPFIRALIEGYSKVLENSQTIQASSELIPKDSVQTIITLSTPQPQDSVQEIISSPNSSNPLANLQPLNAAVAPHMQKDVAMAEIATQFIGMSSAPPETPSSTRNYQQAWGERANTGVYSANDTIMVSGSGPWRGVTQKQILDTFNNHYVPLIDRAIASKSSFVVGNAAGTDQLVKQYLEVQGYKLESVNDGYTRAVKLEQDTTLTNQQPQSALEVSSPVPTQPSSVMSSHGLKLPNSTPISSSNIVQKEVVANKSIQDQETTLEKLRTWYLTAQKLGKSAEYIQRIAEVGSEFKSGAELTEKAVVAMNNDFQELHSINRLTQISQRMGDVFGILQENGEVIVQGKEYLISINNSHKDLTIIKKDGTVFLDIKLGQINQSQVSAEVIDIFEEINNNINQSLAFAKNQHLQV